MALTDQYCMVDSYQTLDPTDYLYVQVDYFGIFIYYYIVSLVNLYLIPH
jgi:hypothetical protein